MVLLWCSLVVVVGTLYWCYFGVIFPVSTVIFEDSLVVPWLYSIVGFPDLIATLLELIRFGSEQRA